MEVRRVTVQLLPEDDRALPTFNEPGQMTNSVEIKTWRFDQIQLDFFERAMKAITLLWVKEMAHCNFGQDTKNQFKHSIQECPVWFLPRPGQGTVLELCYKSTKAGGSWFWWDISYLLTA